MHINKLWRVLLLLLCVFSFSFLFVGVVSLSLPLLHSRRRRRRRCCRCRQFNIFFSFQPSHHRGLYTACYLCVVRFTRGTQINDWKACISIAEWKSTWKRARKHVNKCGGSHFGYNSCCVHNATVKNVVVYALNRMLAKLVWGLEFQHFLKSIAKTVDGIVQRVKNFDVIIQKSDTLLWNKWISQPIYDTQTCVV